VADADLILTVRAGRVTVSTARSTPDQDQKQHPRVPAALMPAARPTATDLRIRPPRPIE
jgi:hypothetical protein